MFRIDAEKCNGCGACITVCPQEAISLIGEKAVINHRLCGECGNCLEVCIAGAIYEKVRERQFIRIKRQAQASAQGKEVSTMPYRCGYGMGYGFRGASPPWPYVGRGRGGLPRCWYPGAYAAAPAYVPPPPPYYGGSWGAPYTGMSREDELGFLKEEANSVKARLDEIEVSLKELEKEEK